MVLVALVEELVADHPSVAGLPVVLVKVGKIGVGEPRGDRDPALGEIAVLGLDAVVVQLPVGVAARQVDDLIRRRALVVLAGNSQAE
jgi:hypothetical protein